MVEKGLYKDAEEISKNIDKETIEEMAIEDIVKIYPAISRPTAFGIINILKFKYGKPKLPKDSVALSKEEYEKLQTDMRRLAYQYCNLIIENKNLKEDLDIEVLKGKETAEKLITKIKQSLNSVEIIRGDDMHKLLPDIGYSVREVDDLLDKIENKLVSK
jgi:hypothetical protein